MKYTVIVRPEAEDDLKEQGNILLKDFHSQSFIFLTSFLAVDKIETVDQ